MASNGDPIFGHHDLEGRVLARLKTADIRGQLLKLVVSGFEAAIAGEVVVVSRRERQKLLARIAQIMFEDILGDLESRAQ